MTPPATLSRIEAGGGIVPIVTPSPTVILMLDPGMRAMECVAAAEAAAASDPNLRAQVMASRIRRELRRCETAAGKLEESLRGIAFLAVC